MDAYELDRLVTNAIEGIVAEIQIPHTILNYAIEPYIDNMYSLPFFIEVGDSTTLIHYLADVTVSGEDISIKFRFDGMSSNADSIHDVADLRLIVDCIDAILDIIDTDNEIYIGRY